MSLTVCHAEAPVTREVTADLSFPAIGCSFFKLLSQLTRKLRRFQRTLGFHGEVLAVGSDDTVRLGHGPHFPQSHPHACEVLIMLRDRKTSAAVYRMMAAAPSRLLCCVRSLTDQELR